MGRGSPRIGVWIKNSPFGFSGVSMFGFGGIRVGALTFGPTFPFFRIRAFRTYSKFTHFQLITDLIY